MISTRISNKNPLARVLLVGSLALSLTACTNEEQGTIFGAILGGIVGSSIDGGGRGHHGRGGGNAGMIIGTIVGASMGSSIGRKLDDADRMRMREAHMSAFESNRSGQRSEWRNPDSGHHGWVEPEPAYENTYGQYCREYTQTVYIGNKEEQAYGKACRQDDGSWEIVNPNSNKYKDKKKKKKYKDYDDDYDY